MGRQGYLARLALGRSPFEAPLRDEQGNFILGPHAHDDAAKGYVQQFNAQGHPVNKNSEAEERRLRRAQNNVLEVAGVVTRTANTAETVPKKMKKGEKVARLKSENQTAFYFQLARQPIIFASLWWIECFRNRLLAFRTYNSPSVLSLMLSEVQAVGARAFFFPGLLSATAFTLCGVFRSLICKDLHESFDLHTPLRTWSECFNARTAYIYLTDFILFGLVWPLQAFSDLQSLHLIPDTAWPRLQSFIPFAPTSPLQPISSISTSPTKAGFGIMRYSTTTSVLVVSYLRDHLRSYLRIAIVAVIHHLVTKPNRPDSISIKAAEDADLDEALIPGLGMALRSSHNQRYHGPRTVLGTFQTAFPTAYNLLHAVLRIPNNPERPSITPFNEDRLMFECVQRYVHFRQFNRSQPEYRQATDEILRLRAVYHVFRQNNINFRADNIDAETWAARIGVVSESPSPHPDSEGVWVEPGASPNNIVDTTNEISGPDDSAETHNDVEEDREAVITASAIEQQQSMVESAVAIETLNDRPRTPDDSHHQPIAPFAPTVPLETLLSPIPTDASTDIVPNPVNPPQTPVPGITRAASLDQSLLQRRARRPTMVEQDQVSPVVLPNVPQHPTQDDSPKDPEDNSKYRVTVLSSYPAEAFATNCGVLLTEVLMLPLDLYYFRLLAQVFLHSSFINSSHQSNNMLFQSGSWPVGAGIGVKQMGLVGTARFLSTWFLTLGIEGVISFVVWSMGKNTALRLGTYFRWREF